MPQKNLEARRVYEKRYREKHRVKIRIRKQGYYRNNREKILAQTKKYQMEHPERRQKWNNKLANKRKLEVLTHYGNKRLACVICGESRIDCLSIDHIRGGGTQHRLKTKLAGEKMYRWLIENDFPVGYQTLCMNCQFIKRKQDMLKEHWVKMLKEK